MKKLFITMLVNLVLAAVHAVAAEKTIHILEPYLPTDFQGACGDRSETIRLAALAPTGKAERSNWAVMWNTGIAAACDRAYQDAIEKRVAVLNALVAECRSRGGTDFNFVVDSLTAINKGHCTNWGFGVHGWEYNHPWPKIVMDCCKAKLKVEPVQENVNMRELDEVDHAEPEAEDVELTVDERWYR